MPIYFGYSKKESYNISLDIPKGYEVESIPSGIKISTEDASCSFSMNIQYNSDTIQIAITKEIKKAIFSADYYDALKDFFQKMIDKQNEKIVLTKI